MKHLETDYRVTPHVYLPGPTVHRGNGYYLVQVCKLCYGVKGTKVHQTVQS